MSPELRSVLLALGQAVITLANATDVSAPAASGADRWLTPKEASERMGVKLRWLHRRWRRLPFCHELPGGARGYRISERELGAMMERRRAAHAP